MGSKRHFQFQCIGRDNANQPIKSRQGERVGPTRDYTYFGVVKDRCIMLIRK